MSSADDMSSDDLTEDAFLGGRVMLFQPRKGYRAATDPVLLAAAVAARPRDRVLDVGCGVGAAMACLGHRQAGLDLHGLEVQSDYAALARRNMPSATVWEGDLFDPPEGLRDIGFDYVMTNPPFFTSAQIASPETGRDTARRESATALEWTRASLKRVRSGGRIAVIHLAERLPEILSGLPGVGDLCVLPLQPRIGRDAKRVIVTGRKGARGPMRLLAPLTLHEGARHESDADDFTAAALAVLRDGAALPMGG